MKKELFEQMAQDWERLNEEYDQHIRSFFNVPTTVFIPEKIVSLKKMQQELYELETKWFDVAERKTTLED